jgi:signal transduction histidine kinase
MMVVPLRARGEILGALTFARMPPGRPYSPWDVEFAEEVAHRAAFAIDNARLYQQAQKATRTRDDLMAVVSHDLRSPLSVIILAAELLSHSGVLEERRLKLVGTMRRSVDLMKHLIEDLLDVASIDAGRFTIVEQPCPVGTLIGEALELMQPLAQQKSLRLESRVTSPDLSFRCDRMRILQVLSNLIGNSIKFSREGGTITIVAGLVDHEVRFTVIDTGFGIPADDLPHIFERFWQARKTAQMGAGLGLAIAKGIVEAHRGKIWAESEPGKGSTFFFTVPTGE